MRTAWPGVTLALSTVTSCALMEIAGAVAAEAIVGCADVETAGGDVAEIEEAFCVTGAPCESTVGATCTGVAIGLAPAFEKPADESTGGISAEGWLTEAN